MRSTYSGSRLVGAMLALLVTGSAWAADSSEAPTDERGGPGPDVTVFELSDTTNYGTAGGVRGYSVGTTSCNVGSTPLQWCDQANGCDPAAGINDHPVIGQNMYRLHNGRMDQIGASWLKHGFLSVNSTNNACRGASNQTCQAPPFGSNQLGVGCTDPYGSSLNGSRPLGRRSEVNPSSGAYPFPIGGGGATASPWNQRVAVAEADMNTTTQPGARFFVEGHYVAPDDAGRGNGLNNASYREVSVNQSNFNLSFVGGTVRQKAAIEAWQTIDPSVEFFRVDIPGSDPVERFHVARKVTQPSAGTWHYEYAIHNMNSDRSANRLTIRFHGPTTISGVGFHDVNAHSNEPYDTADWPGTLTANGVEWITPDFPSSPANANALRWGTMYNFWFDANRGPEEMSLNALGLFKAGDPAQVVFIENTGVLFANGYED